MASWERTINNWGNKYSLSLFLSQSLFSIPSFFPSIYLFFLHFSRRDGWVGREFTLHAWYQGLTLVVTDFKKSLKRTVTAPANSATVQSVTGNQRWPLCMDVPCHDITRIRIKKISNEGNREGLWDGISKPKVFCHSTCDVIKINSCSKL